MKEIISGLAAGLAVAWVWSQQDVRPAHHIVDSAPKVEQTPSFPTPPAALTDDLYEPVRLKADDAGQYWSRGSVEGHPLTFLVDTGASYVSFTKKQAHDVLKLNTDSLKYDKVLWTANGQIHCAHVTLSKGIDVGSMHDEPVIAAICDADMPHPLLGMSFLKDFSVTFDQGTMVISLGHRG